jgi:hypothetical protein
MIKLSELILEAINAPKAVVMAGGAGSGKSYLLSQLSLDSLTQFNPDKYVEDPNHPYHNKLGPAAAQTNKDVAAALEDKTSFVWDTTASNASKVKDILNAGYKVYMVMVYTHPMISYISNFSRSDRSIPAPAVFSTWRNVYQLIGEYDKMLSGNLSVFVSDRGGKYAKEVEGFDTAAKNGSTGLKDYLQKYNTKHGVGGSTFFTPVEMSDQEEQEFKTATAGINWDTENRSEDKAIKTEFLKAYQKNGAGPGADKLKDALNKYRDRKEKSDTTHVEVMDNIVDMLYDPKFQEKLAHSTPQEIDRDVQSFLA